MEVVEIFAGTGGLGLGFKKAGFTLKAAYDFSEAACRNYERVLPDHAIEQVDLAQTSPACLEDGEMIIGGPPCQEFSEANAARPGQNGARNLWPATIKIVTAKRPARFLFENVRGLVKDHRPYFESLLASFRALGYQVDWRLLNCADYGVPQTRHRVIIAGWLPGLEPWRWPSPTHHDGPTFTTRNGRQVEQWVSWDAALGGWLQKDHERDELPAWIIAKYQKIHGHDEPADAMYNGTDSSHSRVWRLVGQPAFTMITDKQSVKRVKITLPAGYYNALNYDRPQRPVGQPAFAVRASERPDQVRVIPEGESVVYRLDQEARCILQTLPPVVDNNEQIGNAVPPLFAAALAGANKNLLRFVAAA